MHVSAPVAIWLYVYAYLRAGGDSTAIWTYVCACFSSCDHMGLRLCMFERRRSYGCTFLYIAAPAVIWNYVYAYASVAGGGGGANVAVARVSCTLRLSAAGGGELEEVPALESCAHLCRHSYKT